jgi:hypothetical protein
MMPSRDGCAECGKPVPERPNARYCSRACQQKAYRARREHDGTDTLARLREQVASLTAALAERDAAIAALHAERAVLHDPAGPEPSRDDTTLPSHQPPAPPAHSVQPEVVSQGEDRWTVTLGGIPAGTVTRRTRPTSGSDWEAHTAGGREAWAGGPPRSLEDAVRMLTSDLRSYLAARHEHHHARIKTGRPRKDGSRLISRGATHLGEIRPAQAGTWQAWVPASATGVSGLLHDPDGSAITWPSPTAAAQAIADYRLAAAEAFWHGQIPQDEHPTMPLVGQPAIT